MIHLNFPLVLTYQNATKNVTLRNMSKRYKKKLSQEPITADIETLSHDGRGIAHINEKIIFIRNALPDEKVLFKYTNTRSTFDEGIAIKILKPSPNRVTPLCPHYNLCGGCSLQHMDHNSQIQHKQQVLLDQLQHFGHVQPKEILPPIIGSNFGYRNKARLGVRFVSKKDKVLVGFREQNGRYITDMTNCKILHETIGEKILALRELIASLENFDVIPQIEVAVGDKQAALIFRHLKPLSESDQDKLCRFAQTNQIECYLQPHKIESIHKIWPIDTPDRLTYQIPTQNIELSFHPTDFTQINSSINTQMINLAIDLLEPNANDNILDLFCGLGNFSTPLAKHCQSVTGIEVSQNMIQRAKNNAKHNGLTNINFHVADLTQDIAAATWTTQKFTKILLDPPRSGALEIMQHIRLLNPEKIVYVSCNPSTLARDADILTHQHGYTLEKAGIMDMFPHTSHVESIALFTR